MGVKNIIYFIYLFYKLIFVEVEEALEFSDVPLNSTDGRKMTKYTHLDKELELKAKQI